MFRVRPRSGVVMAVRVGTAVRGMAVLVMTVPAMSRVFTGFANMPSVFATAFMVGFIEWTCIEA